jgi:hypothetical protein
VREFSVTHQIKLERNYRSFGNILTPPTDQPQQQLAG